MMFGRKTQELQMVMVLEKPKTYKPAPLSEGELKEYIELANKAGAYVPQLIDERFKRFLNEHDIPVFNLQEVIKYMDEKAKKEAKDKNGWLWHPYRTKDIVDRTFGRVITEYSDYYGISRCGVYDKPIPLHALKKVVLIEENFKDQIKLFVSDYAATCPDPFLMAVVVHSSEILRSGEGRYVIDVWNEPGFGLIQQLK